MPGKRLSRYHLQLLLHEVLVRSTIAEEEDKLSKYESTNLAIAKSIILVCKDVEGYNLLLQELERHKFERTYLNNWCMHDWCVDSETQSLVTKFLDLAIAHIKNGEKDLA
jgi:hypothetical protein